MSQCPDSVCSSAGKGDLLHYPVLSAFPLCPLTEEDLIQNPLFCKLLATLSQYVDHSGLTLHLKQELLEAEKELRSQRLSWLQVESLHRLLQEMIQEHRFRVHHSTASAAEDKFYDTLEQCLMVARCAKLLDPSSVVGQEQQLVLGLSAEDVLKQMPAKQDVWQMKQQLPVELQKHLKKKLLSLLSYYQPEWDNESEELKCIKLSMLPALLESESKRAESLTGSNSENAMILQRLTHSYLSEVLECTRILQTLVLDLRLKVQKDIDRRKMEYLELKCELAIQKLREEILKLKLDTYTREKIAVLLNIRQKLDAELKAGQMKKQSLESELASFEIYGRDFEILVEEYSRLREEITVRSWALKEFHSHP